MYKHIELPVFIPSDVVADLLGYDMTRTFLLNRARLQDDMAFPRPAPQHLRPMKWRLDQVQAWLLRQGEEWTIAQAPTYGAGRPLVVIEGGRA